MSVRVIKQGLLDTVQDEGRFGFQHLGINTNGSMDLVSAYLANMLVGNKRDKALIELHFPASYLLFQENCLISLTGADFCPLINDEPVPLNTAVFISENTVLKFSRHGRGSRCYLAVSGGWNAAYWLNSYSTNTKASAGGYKGRPLKKEDIILLYGSGLTLSKTKPAILPVKAEPGGLYTQTKKIRCVAGSEYDWLSNEAKDIFQSGSFIITNQSDRMGYMIQGKKLVSKHKPVLSSAVTSGTIQLLPSGQLVILMADHQTTGGYPKVAHVITADLSRLAQMQPKENMEFELITHTEAEDAFVQQQEYLQQLEDSIQLQLEPYFSNDFN